MPLILSDVYQCCQNMSFKYASCQWLVQGWTAPSHLNPQDTRIDILRTLGSNTSLLLRESPRKPLFLFSPLDADHILAWLLQATTLQPQREPAMSWSQRVDGRGKRERAWVLSYILKPPSQATWELPCLPAPVLLKPVWSPALCCLRPNTLRDTWSELTCPLV